MKPRGWNSAKSWLGFPQTPQASCVPWMIAPQSFSVQRE
jgi:hypothetical protein